MRRFSGWLWQFQSWRLLCVCVAQHELTPGWLVNGIWTHTPFGVLLRDMFLREGWLELAADASRVLREIESRRAA